MRHLVKLYRPPDASAWAFVFCEKPGGWIYLPVGKHTFRVGGSSRFWADTISHESLHLALRDVVGMRAAKALDVLADRHGFLLRAGWQGRSLDAPKRKRGGKRKP